MKPTKEPYLMTPRAVYRLAGDVAIPSTSSAAYRLAGDGPLPSTSRATNGPASQTPQPSMSRAAYGPPSQAPQPLTSRTDYEPTKSIKKKGCDDDTPQASYLSLSLEADDCKPKSLESIPEALLLPLKQRNLKPALLQSFARILRTFPLGVSEAKLLQTFKNIHGYVPKFRSMGFKKFHEVILAEDKIFAWFKAPFPPHHAIVYPAYQTKFDPKTMFKLIWEAVVMSLSENGNHISLTEMESKMTSWVTIRVQPEDWASSKNWKWVFYSNCMAQEEDSVPLYLFRDTLFYINEDPSPAILNFQEAFEYYMNKKLEEEENPPPPPLGPIAEETEEEEEAEPEVAVEEPKVAVEEPKVAKGWVRGRGKKFPK